MIFKQLDKMINVTRQDRTGPSRQAPNLTIIDAIYCTLLEVLYYCPCYIALLCFVYLAWSSTKVDFSSTQTY